MFTCEFHRHSKGIWSHISKNCCQRIVLVNEILMPALKS